MYLLQYNKPLNHQSISNTCLRNYSQVVGDAAWLHMLVLVMVIYLPFFILIFPQSLLMPQVSTCTIFSSAQSCLAPIHLGIQ